MTLGEFARAAVAYRRKYHGSVTRWGTSDHRTLQVGGFKNDPHGWDLAIDVVYDTGPNRQGADTHARLPKSCPICSDFGLKVIHEPSHDHLQPMDFPAGPVAEYAGETKTWV